MWSMPRGGVQAELGVAEVRGSLRRDMRRDIGREEMREDVREDVRGDGTEKG